MDHLVQIISENLKNYRESRNLSLDKLAQATGVSKSMLSQIEARKDQPQHLNPLEDSQWTQGFLYPRCCKNKSPAFRLWKIRNASRYWLTARNIDFIHFSPSNPANALKSIMSRWIRGRTWSPRDISRHVSEYIFVQQGELQIGVEEHKSTVCADQSITFDARRQHGLQEYRQTDAQGHHDALLFRCLLIRQC